MIVHLKTLGCRLNEAELEIWSRQFQQAGHQITNDLQQAQLIVVNSCAVTQDAVRKSKHLIRRLHRDNPMAKLVVSGCYATLNEEEALKMLGVDQVIGNRDKLNLVDTILPAIDIHAMPNVATEPGENPLFKRGRQRAFIKVQDGCRYKCTFCIVTIARGDEASVTPEQVVDQINSAHAQGIQEVVLTGVHLGGYGSDIGSNLVELLKIILKHTDIPRIRLGSLEPWELSESFFDLFTHSRLMPHLHLPLQSGSDEILRKMARRCKTSSYQKIVEQLKACDPRFNITTDIIVGFPGETESEWQRSLNFVEQMAFGDIHIFTYSKREGTKAADFTGHVDVEVKKRRSKILHACAERMKLQFMHENLLAEYPVLWESKQESLETQTSRYFGYTPNYIRVACDINSDHAAVANRILQAKLTATDSAYMQGELVAA